MAQRKDLMQENLNDVWYHMVSKHLTPDKGTNKIKNFTLQGENEL